ncbi:MAG TPA: DUF47 family protein [Thermoanaerobaculia bacterium]
MALFNLIPREAKFYEDYLRMADYLADACMLLDQMISVAPPDHAKAARIKEIEHHCDQLTHDVIQRLNQTFIAPLDREDIHALAIALDDVVDSVDAAASLIPLYQITQIRSGARELTGIIVAQADQIRGAVQALDKRKGLLDFVREINRLEHEADTAHQQAVGMLFQEETNPVTLIKWKEILDMLEDATDRAEDVANLFENILVKNG